jgi:hypothetical protein
MAAGMSGFLGPGGSSPFYHAGAELSAFNPMTVVGYQLPVTSGFAQFTTCLTRSIRVSRWEAGEEARFDLME